MIRIIMNQRIVTPIPLISSDSLAPTLASETDKRSRQAHLMQLRSMDVVSWQRRSERLDGHVVNDSRETRHRCEFPQLASELPRQLKPPSSRGITPGEQAMSGISGIGGLDASAWIGMTGIGGVSAASASAVSGAPTMGASESLALSPSMQALIQTIRNFSSAEIFMALLLAAQTEGCEKKHHIRSATDVLAGLALSGLFRQGPQVNAQFEMPPTAMVAQAGSSPTINVSG